MHTFSDVRDKSMEVKTEGFNELQQHVSDVSRSLQRFGLVDYCVFAASLIVCIIIGIWFGVKNRKKRCPRKPVQEGAEALDYLVGGRKMKIFPVAMSLVASMISGIALMGASTESYLYGMQMVYMGIGKLAVIGIISSMFLPVFHSLKITSVYEYLQMRFDRRIRLLGSVLCTVAIILHLPIVMFIPALAFNQVSGINVHLISIIVCAVCIFYTCVGGIKAVVWTDVIQTLIMVGVLILIVLKGTADIGGLAVLIERNVASGRIEAPNWSLNPTERVTIWGTFFGGAFLWIGKNSIEQMMVQRYLSLPTLGDARKALVLFTVGTSLILTTSFYNGLLIYATFHNCDPLTTKLAQAKDQLLPILVMKVFGDYPGMAGLFISGIFSASLSSLSSGLNSLAAIVLEDFIRPFRKRRLTERQTRYLMRGTVVFFGAVAVALVMVVEKLGTVLQLTLSLSPVAMGPLLGVFLMGVMLPWVDANCALAGTLTGMSAMAYIVTRAQISIAMGEMNYPTKPVSVAGCTYQFENSTSAPDTTDFANLDKSIHHVSFMYYTPIGTCATVIAGLLFTLILGRQPVSNVDPLLVTPFLRNHFFPKSSTNTKATVYNFELTDMSQQN